MAGGEPVRINGYRFTAKPQALCRRFSHDIFPYWQGDKPRFILTVTREGLPAEKQTIHWFVRFATGASTSGQEDIPPLKTGGTVELRIGGKFLGFTGDTLLILPKDLASSHPSPYLTVYAFHTTHKTWLFLTFITGLSAGVVAALMQWLLRVLN